MRVTRRQLLLWLVVSAALAGAFAWAAVAHDSVGSAPAPSGRGLKGTGPVDEQQDPALQGQESTAGHRALEVGLWAGAGVSLAVFGVAAVGFGREVGREKRRLRARRDRKDLLRQVREYELARRPGQRPNT